MQYHETSKNPNKNTNFVCSLVHFLRIIFLCKQTHTQMHRQQKVGTHRTTFDVQ